MNQIAEKDFLNIDLFFGLYPRFFFSFLNPTMLLSEDCY